MSNLTVSALLMACAALLLLTVVLRQRSRTRAMVRRMGGAASPGLRQLGGLALTRREWNVHSEVRTLLDQLGWRRQGQRNLFLGLQLLAPLLAVVLLAGFFFVRGSEITPVSLLLAAGIGFLIPKRILTAAAKARQRRIADDVSTAVPLLRMFFEVGMTVEQALRVLAGDGERVAPELAKELRQVLPRVDAGLELGEELRAMARLVDVDDLTDCIGILEQMLRQGAGALVSLRNLKTLLDERRMTTLQEKVTKMSAKISGVMVLFLLPALLIVLAGPGFIAILQALGGGT